MTEPQVWVLIGVFAAGIFGMLTLVSTLFVRVLRAEIGGLRAELIGEIGGVRGDLSGEIGGLRADLSGEIGGLRAEMRGRFDALEQRVDGLDRDVQALVKHTFGLDRG